MPFPFGDTAKEEEKKEKVSRSVPADELQTHCSICKERFESCWDSEADEWMYKNSILVDGIIYHEKCFEDSKGNVVVSSTPPPADVVSPSVLAAASTPSQGSVVASVNQSVSEDMPALESDEDEKSQVNVTSTSTSPSSVKRELEESTDVLHLL
jgi:hypothetical protein